MRSSLNGLNVLLVFEEIKFDVRRKRRGCPRRTWTCAVDAREKRDEDRLRTGTCEVVNTPTF